jgi:hypothetical protein
MKLKRIVIELRTDISDEEIEAHMRAMLVELRRSARAHCNEPVDVLKVHITTAP